MGEFVRVEHDGAIATIRLDRPPMNALTGRGQDELAAAAADVGADPEVRAVVIYGGEKVFAAGVDIKEMADAGYPRMAADSRRLQAAFTAVAKIPKPVVAAVNGYALGGGCELAMMCDLIIAGESAVFGQPEIKLGVIPGIGGTQRLTRLVGRAKALDLVLTGRTMDAREAERCGLVSRVVPDDRVLAEALEAAAAIASYGRTAVRAARECVDRALETGLRDGLRYERRVFHALFATEDQKEGMTAFLEKRPPRFQGH